MYKMFKKKKTRWNKNKNRWQTNLPTKKLGPVYRNHKNLPKSIAIFGIIITVLIASTFFVLESADLILTIFICSIGSTANGTRKVRNFSNFYFFLISFVISICHQNVKMCLQSTFWISLTDTLNRMQECCTVLCIYSFHLFFFFVFSFVKRLIKLRICEPFKPSVCVCVCVWPVVDFVSFTSNCMMRTSNMCD